MISLSHWGMFERFGTPNAKTIAALRVLDELPDWDDLRGIAPNATGDLSSEEFIRNLRSEWRD